MRKDMRYISDELRLIAEYDGNVLSYPVNKFPAYPKDYYWSDELCSAQLYENFHVLDLDVRDYFRSHGLSFPDGKVKITGLVTVYGLRHTEEMGMGEKFDTSGRCAVDWVGVYRPVEAIQRYVDFQEYCEEYGAQLHVLQNMLGCLVNGLGSYDCSELLAATRPYTGLSAVSGGFADSGGGIVPEETKKGLFAAFELVSGELSAARCCLYDKNNDICSE